MRAARFILFGILLVLIGMSAPSTVAGLLYANSGTFNPALGTSGFFIYLAEIILIGLGFLMGLIGLFQRDPIPAPPVVNLPPTMPLQASQGTLPPDFR